MAVLLEGYLAHKKPSHLFPNALFWNSWSKKTEKQQVSGLINGSCYWWWWWMNRYVQLVAEMEFNIVLKQPLPSDFSASTKHKNIFTMRPTFSPRSCSSFIPRWKRKSVHRAQALQFHRTNVGVICVIQPQRCHCQVTLQLIGRCIASMQSVPYLLRQGMQSKLWQADDNRCGRCWL